MSGHLLHRGQVDAQVEKVRDPSPAQVMGSGGRNPGLEAALPADPPGRGRAEAGQLTGFALEATGLDHRAVERARL
jgi:hypothetical protein